MFGVLWRALKAFLNNRLDESAGYAAFAVFLALFPFLILLTSLAGWLGTAEQANALIERLFRWLPDMAATAIAAVIRDIVTLQRPVELLTAAAIGTVWIASSGIEGIRSGLNTALGVTEPRPFVLRRLQSVLFVFLLAIGLIALSVLLIVAPVALAWLRGFVTIPEPVWVKLTVGRFLLAYLLLVTILAAVYHWLPNARLRWRDSLPGAVLAALLWVGFAGGFAQYVKNFGSYNTTYGSLGGVIVLLVFLNASMAVILYGAAVNQEWRLWRGHRRAHSRDALHGPAPNASLPHGSAPPHPAVATGQHS